MTPESLLDSLAERGIEVCLVRNRLRVSDWLALTPEEQSFIRANRAEVKRTLQDGYRPQEPVSEPQTESVPVSEPQAPEPQATPPEPPPVVYAHGRRITEADVLSAVHDLGDQVEADYREGRMSKVQAYDIARRRLLALLEWGIRP